MKMVPLSVVKDNLKQYIVASHSEDIAVIKKGKASIYLISAQAYEQLKELDQTLEDTYLIAKIEGCIQDVD